MNEKITWIEIWDKYLGLEDTNPHEILQLLKIKLSENPDFAISSLSEVSVATSKTKTPLDARPFIDNLRSTSTGKFSESFEVRK